MQAVAETTERTQYGPEFLTDVSQRLRDLSAPLWLAGNIAPDDGFGLKGFCEGMARRIDSVERRLWTEAEASESDLNFSDLFQNELHFIACTFESLFRMADGGDNEEPLGAFFVDLAHQTERISDLF